MFANHKLACGGLPNRELLLPPSITVDCGAKRPCHRHKNCGCVPTAPVAAPAAISTAASQILRTRSAKPVAVLLLIGRRAARDFPSELMPTSRHGAAVACVPD